MRTKLSKNDILKAFNALDAELNKKSVKGELFLVGGAVMCLVYEARPSTGDVDAFFRPSEDIRKSAKVVAAKLGLGEHWLNDGVKGYLGSSPRFDEYWQGKSLTIFAASPEYMLAMKCLAMRIGEEFHDLEDIRFLIRCLDLTSSHEALAVIKEYYPLERIPQKTLYALEEIFDWKE